MLSVRQNVSLKPYNTFGIDVFAQYFSSINHLEDLRTITDMPVFKNGLLPLGGGSNILFTKNVAEWILHMNTKGIQKVEEDEAHVWLRVEAGEIWHSFVLYCIAQNLSGVENLSLIPGRVGAAPIQNIGAYGAEVQDVIEYVEVWDIHEKGLVKYAKNECKFEYRNSIFKGALKGKVIITSVVFKMNKQHQFNIDYGNVRHQLELMNISGLSLQSISDAIIAIRTSKLPDPDKLGNAGSFFKNPEVNSEVYNKLKDTYPAIPGFIIKGNKIKIPAAWLIEQCGWKGAVRNNYGVHKFQPLVLINHGNASGSDIYNLSEEIINSVQDKFGILLEREVQIY